MQNMTGAVHYKHRRCSTTSSSTRRTGIRSGIQSYPFNHVAFEFVTKIGLAFEFVAVLSLPVMIFLYQNKLRLVFCRDLERRMSQIQALSIVGS